MILLVLQFAACIGMILTGPMLSRHAPLLVFQVLGLLLGIWAIFTMRIGKFNMHATIKQDATLVKEGPYRLIRNPMYTALLLVFSPPALLDGLLAGPIPDPRRVTFLTLLVIVLGIKIRVEEKLLAQHFSDYPAYAAKTKRLIPWIL